MNILKKLLEHLSNGEYKEFFKLLMILFPFVSVVGIIVVVIFNFAANHLELIVFLTLLVMGVLSYIISRRQKQEPPSTLKTNKPIQLQHQLVTEIMFSVFKSLSVQLHIQSPAMESQIKDKIPYYTDNATNVTYFRYNVIISGEPLEETLFKEILNQGIIKALGSSTSKLGRPVFEHDGYHFQKLTIEEVNFTGASWLVVVAIVDNDYAVVLESRAQTENFINDNKEDFTFYQDRDF